MCAVTSPAAAQIGPSPILEPQKIEENFKRSAEPRSRPQIIETQRNSQIAPEGAKDTTFLLKDVEIEGATAIPVSSLLEDWPHKPGETLSVADVFDLANIITRKYAEAGYALSFAVVPQQEIADGHVKVRVVEGYIDQIAIVGDPGNASSPIERLTQHIKDSRPLKTADLERYLLLVNDLPGVTALATISPSEDNIGGSLLSLTVSRKSVEGEFGYNNYLPEELDRHVVGGTVRFNGAVTGSDQIRISGLHTLTSDAYWNLGGGISSFVGSNGARIEVNALHSKVRPSSAELAPLDYVGRATSLRASFEYPIIRSRARNLGVSIGTELDNSDVDLLGVAFQRDRLRILEAAISYDFAGGDGSVTLFRIGAQRGLGIFDAKGDSRANGSPTYTVLTGDIQRNQPIAPLANGNLSLFASMFGQVALDDPLLSGAECGFGGRQFGRRFDGGSASGDHCALGSVELRWTLPLQLSKSAPNGAVQVYAFADGGVLGQKGTLEPGERREESGASGGFGLRMSADERFDASIEASHQLAKPASVAGAQDFLITASLSVRF